VAMSLTPGREALAERGGIGRHLIGTEPGDGLIQPLRCGELSSLYHELRVLGSGSRHEVTSYDARIWTSQRSAICHPARSPSQACSRSRLGGNSGTGKDDELAPESGLRAGPVIEGASTRFGCVPSSRVETGHRTSPPPPESPMRPQVGQTPLLGAGQVAGSTSTTISPRSSSRWVT
jgi:hypothetical protein